MAWHVNILAKDDPTKQHQQLFADLHNNINHGTTRVLLYKEPS